MFSVSQVGKNAYRVGKTKCLLRVDAYEANTPHVLAHSAPPPQKLGSVIGHIMVLE